MSTSEWRAGADLGDRLAAFALLHAEAGIFTDFDGSLAPIVGDPSRSRAPSGTGPLLDQLAKDFALVAVISGRPVAFLSDRLRSTAVRYVGLYGLEESFRDVATVVPEALHVRAAIDRALERLSMMLLGIGGVYIEDKGLALSVHFRRADDPEAAMERARLAVEEIALSEGLAPATRGKQVLEIGPRVAVDKGSVTRRLIAERGLRAGLAIGDDVGDIAMFDALDDLELAVRIAVGTEETPAELVGRADVLVRTPEEVVELLRALVSALDR